MMMQDHVFDQKMRAQAEREAFTASPKTQHRLEAAMRKGASEMGRRKQNGMKTAAWSVLAAAMVLILLMVQPPNDRWDRSAILSDHEAMPTPVPVTVPEGEVKLTVENRMLKAEAVFSNHTGDIWLITWNAEPQAKVRRTQDPTELIWLETGITFTDHASWKLFSQWEEQSDEMEWDFTGYRVDASLLHWIEGEWLLPGEEGYAEQQMLIEDAFVNGALILAPGDWPEGTSGEMQLVLPDSYQKEHPEMDALTYYVQAGMLRMEAAVSHPVHAE